jgi:hypothetical protein
VVSRAPEGAAAIAVECGAAVAADVSPAAEDDDAVAPGAAVMAAIKRAVTRPPEVAAAASFEHRKALHFGCP